MYRQVGAADGEPAHVIVENMGRTEGPETVVVCDAGSFLERIGQDAKDVLGGGHIDTGSATYCYTPETITWLLAAATG